MRTAFLMRLTLTIVGKGIIGAGWVLWGVFVLVALINLITVILEKYESATITL